MRGLCAAFGTAAIVGGLTLILLAAKFYLWKTKFVIWRAKKANAVTFGKKYSVVFSEGNPKALSKGMRTKHWATSYKYKVNGQTYYYVRIMHRPPEAKVKLYYLPSRPKTAVMEDQKDTGTMQFILYAMTVAVFILLYSQSPATYAGT